MAAAGLSGTDPLECLSAAAVSERLGVSKSQVYSLARRGELPHVKLGSGVVFPRRQLEEHLRREAERSVAGGGGTNGAGVGGPASELVDVRRRRRDVRRRRA